MLSDIGLQKCAVFNGLHTSHLMHEMV